MSRIKDLKEKHPLLALSIADVLTLIDPTDQNKYIGMMGKIVKNRLEERFKGHESYKTEIANLIGNPSVKNESYGYAFILYQMLDMIGGNSNIEIFKTFIELNERGVIENKDIQQYNSIEDIQGAISLVELKEMDKEMASQVVRIFEDDEWLVVRPLTFEASCKYGAGTKWCTTSTTSPEHFHRYWSRGALIYMINKKTGYKIATQKYYDESDRSTLWNAADQEVNWADVNVPSYIFEGVRDQLMLEVTNKSLCSPEIQDRVETVCFGYIKSLYVSDVDVAPIDLRIAHEQPQRLDAAILNALRENVEEAINDELISEPSPTVEEPVQDEPIFGGLRFEEALSAILARRGR